MKRKSIFTYIGLVLIFSALLFTLYNLVSDFLYGKKASENVETIVEYIEENNNEPVSDFRSQNLKSMEIDGLYYVGVIEMPSVNITLPVLYDCKEESLEVGAGVYVGTPYAKNFVIGAHSLNYGFRDIRKLVKGDLVYFEDIYGNVFEYEVVLQEVLHETEIESMITSGYDLTLFTCRADLTLRVTVRLNKTNEYYKNS